MSKKTYDVLCALMPIPVESCSSSFCGVPFSKEIPCSKKGSMFLENYDCFVQDDCSNLGVMIDVGSMLFPPHDPENDFAVLLSRLLAPPACPVTARLAPSPIAIEEGLIHPKTPGFLKNGSPSRFGTGIE